MEQRIFITGTMRTGSSLVSNALSVHSKILILSDRVHFFRFIYKQCDPLSEKNVYRMLLLQRLRLYHRYNVELDVEKIFNNIKKKAFTYKVIYDEIMNIYLNQTNKTMWGDDPAMQWREIPDFLMLFPEGKVIHIYRDPRAVLTSWKKVSGAPNNGYLGSLFNWIDSVNYVDRYKTMLSKSSYFPLRYEDLATEPKKWMKKLCTFLNVEFEETMVRPEKWKALLIDDLVALGKSSFDGTVVGFSHKRIARWKELIEGWELCLIESLAGDLLTKHGYELIGGKFSPSEFAMALEKFKKNEYLLKLLNVYLSNGEGSNRYPLDPRDYRNWGIPGTNKWFKDTPEAKDYLDEVALINREL